MTSPFDHDHHVANLYGEHNRCPTCGAVSRIVPSDTLRWACGVCGSPRVPWRDTDHPPEEAMDALRAAGNAKRQGFAWRAGAWAAGIPAAVAFVLAVLLGPASYVAGGVLVAIGVVLAVLASKASRSASTARKRMRSELDRGWEAAMEGMLAQSAGTMTAREIARALRISEADVEATLTTLSVHERIRVAVQDNADLAYSHAEAEQAAVEQAEQEAQAEAPAQAKKVP